MSSRGWSTSPPWRACWPTPASTSWARSCVRPNSLTCSRCWTAAAAAPARSSGRSSPPSTARSRPCSTKPHPRRPRWAWRRRGSRSTSTASRSPGATAPLSLAGTVLQINCEVLRAVALLRLVVPDCALIYSSSAGIIDMRTSRSAYATPEVLLMDTAMTRLAHWYRLPALSVGSAAKRCTRASGRAWRTWPSLCRPPQPTGTCWSGSPWWSPAGRCSLQKMVLDAEIMEQLDRFMAGMALDDLAGAIEAISSVGPGGHYLGLRQTREGLRRGEHWAPDVLARTAPARPGPQPRTSSSAGTDASEPLLAEHRPPSAAAPPRASRRSSATRRTIRRCKVRDSWYDVRKLLLHCSCVRSKNNRSFT